MKELKVTGNLIDWVTPKGNLPMVENLNLNTFEEMDFRPFVYEDPKIKSETSSWDIPFFENKIGHIEVDVYVSADGTFPGGKGPYDPKKYRLVKMPLSECLKCLHGEIQKFYFHKNEKYYLYQAQGDLLEKLSDKVDFRDHVPSDDIDRNFWLSGPGNITPIHYDLNDNFLVQLAGRKKVLLWNPSSYDDLKFNPIGQLHDRQSKINPYDPGIKELSGISNAEIFAHDLTQGQVLYIPFGWPHFVYTETFAASVNYWWDPAFVLNLFSSLQSSNSQTNPLDLVNELVIGSRPDLEGMIKGMINDGGIFSLLQKEEPQI